jgi:ribonuclease HIII
MTRIVIDRKTYVLITEREYEALQMKAALKTKPVKKLSLATGKKHAFKLIDKWAKGK